MKNGYLSETCRLARSAPVSCSSCFLSRLPTPNSPPLQSY